jgi:hypothetical protein
MDDLIRFLTENINNIENVTINNNFEKLNFVECFGYYKNNEKFYNRFEVIK